MNWVRKAFVHLLSVFLFLALVWGVLAASIIINLSHPAKLETWLTQSNLYNGFVSNAIKQGLSSGDNADNSDNSSGGISLTDSAVQQAAQSAFSPSLLQKDVNTFLESNYAWLQGKTAKPEFKIDLTEAKQTFAEQVGGFVKTHLTSLPVCTAAQTAALGSNIDPLSVTCRPAGLDPATEGAATTAKLAGSDGFLSNSVITPTTINPKEDGGGQPYYEKLSFAPKAYQLATKIPLLLALIALLCMVGIFFVAPRKRRGLRRIAIVVLEAGVVLVVLKFVGDYVFKKALTGAFNKSNVGELQVSLTNFAHHVETNLVKIPFYAGIAFVVLAVAAFAYLMATRNRDHKSAGADTPHDEGDDAQAATEDSASAKRKLTLDVMSRPGQPKSPTTAPTLPAKPAAPSRRRLIQ